MCAPSPGPLSKGSNRLPCRSVQQPLPRAFRLTRLSVRALNTSNFSEKKKNLETETLNHSDTLPIDTPGWCSLVAVKPEKKKILFCIIGCRET